MDRFDPQEIVDHIDSFGHNLSEWEVQFIAGFMDNPPESFTEKQIAIIDRIYNQKC